jgi:hypothetical protein
MCTIDDPNRGGFHMRGFHGIKPETDQTCHYFWSMASASTLTRPRRPNQVPPRERLGFNFHGHPHRFATAAICLVLRSASSDGGARSARQQVSMRSLCVANAGRSVVPGRLRAAKAPCVLICYEELGPAGGVRDGRAEERRHAA